MYIEKMIIIYYKASLCFDFISVCSLLFKTVHVYVIVFFFALFNVFYTNEDQFLLYFLVIFGDFSRGL